MMTTVERLEHTSKQTMKKVHKQKKASGCKEKQSRKMWIQDVEKDKGRGTRLKRIEEGMVGTLVKGKVVALFKWMNNMLIEKKSNASK